PRSRTLAALYSGFEWTKTDATMNENLAQQIVEALQRRRPHAAFVSEVVSTIRPAPMATDLEATLRSLHEQRQILIVDHSAPDVHLVGTDLRVLAWLPD